MRRFHSSLTDFSKKVRTFASAFEKAAEKSLCRKNRTVSVFGYGRIERYVYQYMSESYTTSSLGTPPGQECSKGTWL